MRIKSSALGPYSRVGRAHFTLDNLACRASRPDIIGSLRGRAMSHILIVDDSPTIRRMVKASLAPLGVEFIEAASGLEAIEQLACRTIAAPFPRSP